MSRGPLAPPNVSHSLLPRNYLWQRQGDAINAILAAVGYNFRRLIRWLSYLVQNPRPTRGSTSGPP
jgi:uncharacterized membrane protein